MQSASSSANGRPRTCVTTPGRSSASSPTTSSASTGEAWSATEEVASAKATASGDFELLAETFTDLRVRVYGDFAVANAISNEKARFKGKDVAPRYRRTTVWVRRDGTWRCVSFHGSLIQEP
jgi:uncharacterized protein DUF4440